MNSPTLEKPSTANMSVKLEISERDRIKSLALIKHRSSHYIMKEAIQRYLDEEEAEQQQIAAAGESLDHYKKTGLHVTLDEMKTWLKAKTLDRNTPMPICHT